MDIQIARIGLCWGIELAYERLNKVAADGEVHVTHRWGPTPTSLIWDPMRRIVEDDDPELHRRYPNLGNVRLLESADQAADGMRVAIGHHGAAKEAVLTARAGKASVFDFKCPFIAKSDNTADKLAAAGHDIIAFGKPGNHHCEYACEQARAAGRIGLIAEVVAPILDALHEAGRNWACIGQVTANTDRWARFRADLAASGVAVRIVDTVCSDSHDRQAEAIALAGQVDLVLVINDNGGSTRSVLERCLAANPNSILVDPRGDLPDMTKANSLAIVGGIHVPDWIMADYAARLRDRVD
jgi:4-hydroxy-3-methylbut-2-enyl diphosphate reductase